MQKWNMIIDVAECTNCQLCTLAAMDEYVGNDWPGYSAPMPRHGHRWIDILQKERGQVPMIDIAYVPTMCNNSDDAPSVKAATNGPITNPQDGIVDCVEGAAVKLVRDGKTLAETASDNYGDFKFDRLPENSGRYKIEIAVAGKPPKSVDIELGTSINLGEIRL